MYSAKSTFNIAKNVVLTLWVENNTAVWYYEYVM